MSLGPRAGSLVKLLHAERRSAKFFFWEAQDDEESFNTGCHIKCDVGKDVGNKSVVYKGIMWSINRGGGTWMEGTMVDGISNCLGEFYLLRVVLMVKGD